MKLISNRGNIDGPNPELENKQDYIQMAINRGYDVKIDVWLKDNRIYLGSDGEDYLLDIDWLERNRSKLWLQCRDIELLEKLIILDPVGGNLHLFTHEDSVAMTNRAYLWGHEGPASIALLHEKEVDKELNVFGICSDYIQSYKD